MTRKEAQHAAEQIFGPMAECVRTSARERSVRFHICAGSVATDGYGSGHAGSGEPTADGTTGQNQSSSGRLLSTSDAFVRSDPYVPVILGSGDSWESAIEHARATPNGQLAIKQAQEGKEFAQKALQSKSELEFATLIEEQAVKEAIERGANEAAIAVIRQKFEKAKEKISGYINGAAKA